MDMTNSIPHGGKLINRKNLNADTSHITKQIILDRTSLSDLELISNGAYSPLEGFLTSADYYSVLHETRLTNNLIWSIPITLPLSKKEADLLKINDKANLIYDGCVYGYIEISDIFLPDKQKEASMIYQTNDRNHPGVHKLFNRGEVYIGGPVTLTKEIQKPAFLEGLQLDPAEVRKYIATQGWETVVGFQTRNPVHRAHEYIQKLALELVDGLLLHPLVGETKKDDIPAETRMKSYQVLLANYYPQERVLLSSYPQAMRYAGPREALHHAIARKNYGCTHFIVGRDHAGVGDYYGTYDAQKLFLTFPKEELGITILPFEHTFYCIKCDGMASHKTCPHDSSLHLHLSGTKVREMLKQGAILPKQFSRPEVIEILMDDMRRNE